MSRIFSVFFCVLFVTSAFASCPSISQIKRYSLGTAGFYWADNAEGWLGYTQNPDNNDTTIDHFDHTIWWNYQNITPTALCYYVGNKGSVITMSQGNWNRRVSEPTGFPWGPIVFEGNSAESCYQGLSACKFTYY